MYQSASKPALLCGINLLVIDSKPAPSLEVICFKTSVTASKSFEYRVRGLRCPFCGLTEARQNS